MTIDRQRRRRLWTVAIGVAAMAATACGSAGTSDTGGGSGSGGAIKTGPGIDAAAKTINLGVLTPLSGPVAAPIGKPLTRGQEVYFKALNDKGGIDGWKVNLTEKDTAYNAQQQVQQYNAIVDQVAFFAQSLGSPTTLAIQKQADQGGVLIGAASQSSSWVTDKVMIVVGNPYSVDIANGIEYIVSKLNKPQAKIAIMYQNDEYGQDGLRGYKAALDKFKFSDVGQVPFNATDTQFSSQLVTLKGAGAEYVFLVATPTSAGKIFGTGAAMKYLPQWMFQGPAWSGRLMTADGTATGAPTPIHDVLPGHVNVLGYQPQWGDTSVPGMAAFLADQQKYAADQPPDYYFMYGYAEAEVEAAIIKKAIANNDLSRPGLLDARLNLGKLSLGGLLPDINYTPALGPVSRSTGITVVDATVPGFLKQVQPFFVGDVAQGLTFQAAG